MKISAVLFAVFVTFTTAGHAAEGNVFNLIRYLSPLDSGHVVGAAEAMCLSPDMEPLTFVVHQERATPHDDPYLRLEDYQAIFPGSKFAGIIGSSLFSVGESDAKLSVLTAT